MHSPNRSYITEPNSLGERVQVYWLNGAQYCSSIPKGEEPNKRQFKGSTTKVELQERPTGETVSMTYKQLRAEVLKGHKVFSKSGQSIPCTQRAEKTPDKVVKVIKEGNNFKIV